MHKVFETYNEIDDTGIFKGDKSESFRETSDHIARPLYRVDHSVSWKKFRKLTVREIRRNPTAEKLIVSITCLNFNFISKYENTKSYLEMLSFGVNSFSVNSMGKSFDDVVDSICRVIDDKTETTWRPGWRINFYLAVFDISKLLEVLLETLEKN